MFILPNQYLNIKHYKICAFCMRTQLSLNKNVTVRMDIMDEAKPSPEHASDSEIELIISEI